VASLVKKVGGVEGGGRKLQFSDRQVQISEKR